MKANDQGFTLIEVLVAFAILSVAIISSFQIFSDGLRQIKTAEQRSAEISAARAVLDQFISRPNLNIREEVGLTGSLKWKIVVVPMTEISPDILPLRIAVSIEEQASSRVLLETIILQKKAP